jgi:YcdC-like protein, C-terminal region
MSEQTNEELESLRAAAIAATIAWLEAGSAAGLDPQMLMFGFIAAFQEAAEQAAEVAG